MSRTADPLAVYLEVLFGRARLSTLVEVRWRTPSGMNHRFIPAGDHAQIEQEVLKRGVSTDVYVGVLPRWRPAGSRRSIVGDGRTVWVDLDLETAARALEPIDPVPSLTIASGGPGHLHAYWTLAKAMPPRVIERANRRLAWALGGDLGSTDATRILRPPSTIHCGRGGAPVELVAASDNRPCRLAQLVGGLPDPPGLTRDPRRSTRRADSSTDTLLSVSPDRYVALLTGQPAGRSRKVRCPLHEDQTASLHVYTEPERGWFCFGCRRGGTVYDLAAGMWHLEPRGEGFRVLQTRLRQLLA
jgi:hypothetical protein